MLPAAGRRSPPKGTPPPDRGLRRETQSVPNKITSQDLESLNLPELGRHLTLRRAGWIQPTSARNACDVSVEDITPCVLYCEIVDGHVMKFGTAGSLRHRQVLNRGTINNILAFQDGRYSGVNRKITDPRTYDKYKRQAPAIIRSGKSIEIWATSLSSHAECQDPKKRCNAQCTACKGIEGELNERYRTVEHGWATRRN